MRLPNRFRDSLRSTSGSLVISMAAAGAAPAGAAVVSDPGSLAGNLAIGKSTVSGLFDISDSLPNPLSTPLNPASGPEPGTLLIAGAGLTCLLIRRSPRPTGLDVRSADAIRQRRCIA